MTYVGGWGDADLLDRLVADTAARAGLAATALPYGVRIRDTGAERFWFNHNPQAVDTPVGAIPAAGFLRLPLAEDRG